LHFAVEDKRPIERVVAFVNSPPINLRQENKSEGMEHLLGCVRKQVAHADQQTVLAKARCMRQAGKRKELDVYLRKGCPRLEQEKGFLEYRL
jgi:hypothetical protein